MHEQIFKHRGWWQRLDREHARFAELLTRFNLKASDDNVREIWQAAWIASWPYVELLWVPLNHRVGLEAKAHSLLRSMRKAGLELTAEYNVVEDIASCGSSSPKNGGSRSVHVRTPLVALVRWRFE